MCFKTTIFTLLGSFFLLTQAVAQNVIEDEGVGMSAQELEVLVQYWTPGMQQAAANDVGDRFELLSMALANKKLAEESRQLTPEEDPERYWRNQFIVRNVERKFVVDHYMDTLEIPDMSELAQETYLASKDKYAAVPESRKASHLLLRCSDAECNIDERRAQAQKILAELHGGAVFEELVAQYSEDPGSKDNGGVFDRWLSPGMQGVAAHFVEGVFSVDGVGNYSGVVESQFGFHIIRLDEVKAKSYKPFDEVRPVIIDALETDYKMLAAKEFDAKYRLTDDTFIDKDAMEAIFAPYAAQEKPAQ